MENVTIKKQSSAKASKDIQGAQFADLIERATAAGIDAGVKCAPIPMDVIDRAGGQLWRIDDGACGFAWVTVKPANCAFANWAKRTGIMRPAYGGGVQYWVSEFGQSVDRKSAFAGAFADVLREAGINAFAGSRLD